MSIQAVSWVLDHSESRGLARLVLISLANHADKETGECWPAQRTIARESGISAGSVVDQVRSLVALGELEIVDQGGPRQSSRYRMTFAQEMSIERSGDERSARPKSERSAQPRGEQNRQLTVIEPSEETTSLQELKQTLVDVFGEPPPKGWSLYNRIATWIRDRGGTSVDVRLRASMLAEEWGRKAVTPAALEKHWTRYDSEVGNLSDVDVEKYQAEVRQLQRRARAQELQAQSRGLPT